MKHKLDEKTALAIIFANTRRKPPSRKEDILTIAKCFDFLEGLYKSRKAVIEKVDLSNEMIRQFLTALKLPKEIQNMIAQRKIDSVDAVRNLATIDGRDKQIETAKLYASLQSKDARDINRIIKGGKISTKEAKKIIDKTKPKGFHVFVMDFDDDTYKTIIRVASSRKTKPAELVKKIVTDWLDKIRKKQGYI